MAERNKEVHKRMKKKEGRQPKEVSWCSWL